MPSGKKRKRHKMSTHKRKKDLKKIDINIKSSLYLVLDQYERRTNLNLYFEFVLCA